MSLRARVALALVALWFIWGSTFIAVRFALDGIPPLFISGFRYFLAGATLYAIARLRGLPAPTRGEWRSASIVGALFAGANACVVVAQQWVSAGVAAVALASIPLWVALVAGLFGKWPAANEWLGLAVGLAGVLILQTGGELRASPAGASLLVLACAAWAFGSILGPRLSMPRGLMASAAQMLAGGSAVLLVALARGDRMHAVPPVHALAGFAYLSLVGSLIAYTAYQFLLKTVSPTLAASYSYVNPLVALALGAAVFGERVTPRAAGALLLILVGVALLALRSAALPAARPSADP
jgi:drug/metabolite transporter (DMT)-like permease